MEGSVWTLVTGEETEEPSLTSGGRRELWPVFEHQRDVDNGGFRTHERRGVGGLLEDARGQREHLEGTVAPNRGGEGSKREARAEQKGILEGDRPRPSKRPQAEESAWRGDTTSGKEAFWRGDPREVRNDFRLGHHGRISQSGFCVPCKEGPTPG